MATDALADGFEELLWCDSDIAFEPDVVEQVRSYGLPFVAAVYAKKNGKDLACVFPPERQNVGFGKSGGLCELRYAGFGFVLTHRCLFETIRGHFKLPNCNNRFDKPVVPYFLPMISTDGSTYWYLPEDFAFCERAKQCGFKIMGDTSIILGHIGKYQFTWRDVSNWSSYQKTISQGTLPPLNPFGLYEGHTVRQLFAEPLAAHDQSSMHNLSQGSSGGQEIAPVLDQPN